jgi:uncharacterized membrane protein
MAKQFIRRPQRLAFLAAIVAAITMYPRTLSAQASEFTDNEFVPFSLITAGCGDVISLSGTLHVLTHVTFNAAGGITIKTHFQPQGATGVGLVSGAQYQGTGVTQETLTDNGPGPQFEFTFINNFRMISKGTTPNFDVHQTVHITVNNNGDVTATVDNTSIECRG